MVEVEWVLSGQRAIEPRLEVRRPAALVLVRTAAVGLADARHPGVDGLQRRMRSNVGKGKWEYEEVCWGLDHFISPSPVLSSFVSNVS